MKYGRGLNCLIAIKYKLLQKPWGVGDDFKMYSNSYENLFQRDTDLQLIAIDCKTKVPPNNLKNTKTAI